MERPRGDDRRDAAGLAETIRMGMSQKGCIEGGASCRWAVGMQVNDPIRQPAMLM